MINAQDSRSYPGKKTIDPITFDPLCITGPSAPPKFTPTKASLPSVPWGYRNRTTLQRFKTTQRKIHRGSFVCDKWHSKKPVKFDDWLKMLKGSGIFIYFILVWNNPHIQWEGFEHCSCGSFCPAEKHNGKPRGFHSMKMIGDYGYTLLILPCFAMPQDMLIIMGYAPSNQKWPLREANLYVQ